MKTKYGAGSKLFDTAGRRITKIFYRFTHSTNNYKSHQGAKECKRRVAQGRAGECYVHFSQYPSQHTFLPVNF